MIDDLFSAWAICGGYAILLCAGVLLHYICLKFSRTRRLMTMIEKSLEGGK